MSLWTVSHKYDKRGAELADGHYSRRTVGSPQFMPPGETLVLVRSDAVFGWWRPHPRSGLKAMNGLDGWTCTIFRNTGPVRSSELILAAERELAERHDCGPSGLITYVDTRKVQSRNPGACFRIANWRRTGQARRRHLWLFQKPFSLAGC